MNQQTNELFIGLMSGTSCDGVDASLIKSNGQECVIIANTHIPYPTEFTVQLKELCSQFLPYFEVEKRLTEYHIEATIQLLQNTKYTADDIRAIGFHGQTIFHDPRNKITCQIGNPYLLAISTGIDVIYDFRRRDVALGGNGAPLVPIFHKALVANKALPSAVINIGGVANITYISQKDLIAFDTGPGNALIDDAMNKYYNLPYDNNGEVAKRGIIDNAIVEKLMQNEYFTASYPKSLDRNDFNFLLPTMANHKANNIITTLSYITASTIAYGIKSLPLIPNNIFLCGGGSKNSYIISKLEEILAQQGICPTIQNISAINDADADYVESQAFAYLAARYIYKLPSAFKSTTGAKKDNICGTLVSP